MKRNFTWDGEKIKESVQYEDRKHTPKDILTALDNFRSEIDKIDDSLKKLEEQKKQQEQAKADYKKLQKELGEFEEQCEKLQKEKIQDIIRKIHEEVYNKALKESQEEIAKDPDAYSDNQKKQLPYLKYQKYLATHEKMSDKIARRMITEHLFNNPIFENPFKD